MQQAQTTHRGTVGVGDMTEIYHDFYTFIDSAAITQYLS